MPTADDFRTELRSQLRSAQLAGERYIDITSGTLHRAVGDYPDPKRHRMKTCCDVMIGEQKAGDIVLTSPPRGRGATLTIRYKLPREPVVHHVSVTETMQLKDSLQAELITVTRPEELRPALAQRERAVVIENEELKRKLSRLAYWQEARWWFFAALIYSLLNLVITHQYKLEAEWHLKWKIEQSSDGKLTLTP